MDIPTILARKYAGTFWNLSGNDYSGLEWLSDDVSKPTKKTLEKLWPEVTAEIEAENEARIFAKQSAIAKLSALGLTLDEVKVAFGLESEAE